MGKPNVPTNQSLTQIKSVGEILHELVNSSDEPLYKGYRKNLVSKENNAEKGGKDYE